MTNHDTGKIIDLRNKLIAEQNEFPPLGIEQIIADDIVLVDRYDIGNRP